MRYITERQSYDQDDIKNALGRSIKSGDIKMNISFDEFVNKSLNLQKPEIGSFESMAQGGFISAGDEERMENYINRFKNLDIDTSKLEEMFPKYQEYKKFPMDEPHKHDYQIWYVDQRRYTNEEDPEGENWHREDKEARKEYEDDLNQWYEDDDKHQIVREEFNNEVRRLCIIAKEKLEI